MSITSLSGRPVLRRPRAALPSTPTRGGLLPAIRSRRLRSIAALGALALTTSVLGASVFATPAQAAPGDAFSPADPLVFVAQELPTRLYQAVTDASGEVTFAPEGPASALNYNAIAYNTADDYVYGIAASAAPGIPAQSLIRVGQGGTVTRVGTSIFMGANVGVFGPGGYLYVGASGTPTMQVIDVRSGTLVRPLSLGGTQGAPDLAFANGFFWGSIAENNVPLIYRVNPTTGGVASFPSPLTVNDAFAGAAWTFGNGNLGFSSNVTGVVSQLAVTNPASATPTFTIVSQSPGPASGNNDGAASPGQPTDLTIAKTGPTALVPGGTVTYTLTVTNDGPGNSSGFVVNDAVPAPLTNVQTTSDACTVTGNDVRCVGGRTLAGESATFTITASVPSNATGSVVNTATVTSNEEDPTPGNDTSTTTGSIAALSVVKVAGEPTDVNGNGITDAGDTIQFTFDVTNGGETALTGIAVSDPLVGGVLCPTTTLAPGQTVTCAAGSTYVITPADVSAGAVTNTATASGTTTDGDTITSEPSTTTTTTTVSAPGLSVVKSADLTEGESFVAGEVVTYSFVVSNTGNVPVDGIAVVEGDFSGTGELSPVSCPATSLAVNAQQVCTATYTLTQEDVDAGSVTNSASATGTPTGSETPIESDPSTSVIPTPAEPAITVVKSATPTTVVAAGQTVTYSFFVTNAGNVTLTDVGVLEGDFTGTGELDAATCPTTTLVPGESITCSTSYTVTQADVDAGGSLSNTATAGGTTPGGVEVPSEPSTETVDLVQAPSLTIVKTSDVEEITEVGQVVTYTFVVTNAGNVTITDPVIDDSEFSGSGELSDLLCEDVVTLAPGDDVTCTATYSVTQADVDAGVLSNTATVSGTTPGGEPTEPSTPSTELVPVAQQPLLTVVKTADVEQIDEVGQVVTYSFVLTNEGNVTITDATVVEGAFSGAGSLSAIECPAEAAALAPGDDVLCTATYSVVEGDLTGGALTNTATAAGTTPGGGDFESTPSTASIDSVAPPAPPSQSPAPSTPPAAGGSLPQTGADILAPAAVIALLMLALGAVVLVRRHQRHVS